MYAGILIFVVLIICINIGYGRPERNMDLQKKEEIRETLTNTRLILIENEKLKKEIEEIKEILKQQNKEQ